MKPGFLKDSDGRSTGGGGSERGGDDSGRRGAAVGGGGEERGGGKPKVEFRGDFAPRKPAECLGVENGVMVFRGAVIDASTGRPAVPELEYQARHSLEVVKQAMALVADGEEPVVLLHVRNQGTRARTQVAPRSSLVVRPKTPPRSPAPKAVIHVRETGAGELEGRGRIRVETVGRWPLVIRGRMMLVGGGRGKKKKEGEVGEEKEMENGGTLNAVWKVKGGEQLNVVVEGIWWWKGKLAGELWTELVRLSVQIAPKKPDPPKIIAGEEKEGSIRWTGGTPNGAAIEEYEVERERDGGEFEVVGRTEGKQLKNILDKGEAAVFRVRARNRVGWSAWSAKGVVRAAEETPGAPERVSVVESLVDAVSVLVEGVPPECEVQVDLGAVDKVGEEGMVGVRVVVDGEGKKSREEEEGFEMEGVRWSRSTVVFAESSGRAEALIRHLKPLSWNAVRVRAKNSGGIGEWSEPIVVGTIGQPPNTPLIEVDLLENRPRAQWKKTGDVTTVALEAVYSSRTERIENDQEVAVFGRGMPGEKIAIRARAANRWGYSEWTAPQEIRVHSIPPGPPSRISAKATSPTTIRIEWGECESTGGADCVTATEVEIASENPRRLVDRAKQRRRGARIKTQEIHISMAHHPPSPKPLPERFGPGIALLENTKDPGSSRGETSLALALFDKWRKMCGLDEVVQLNDSCFVTKLRPEAGTECEVRHPDDEQYYAGTLVNVTPSGCVVRLHNGTGHISVPLDSLRPRIVAGSSVLAQHVRQERLLPATVLCRTPDGYRVRYEDGSRVEATVIPGAIRPMDESMVGRSGTVAMVTSAADLVTAKKPRSSSPLLMSSEEEGEEEEEGSIVSGGRSLPGVVAKTSIPLAREMQSASWISAGCVTPDVRYLDIRGLVPGETYQVRVRYANEAGMGKAALCTVTTPGVPPSHCTAITIDANALLHITPPSDTGGGRPERIVTTIEQNTPLHTPWISSSQPSTLQLSRDLLPPGKTVKLRIWAKSDIGNGPETLVHLQTAPASPRPPRNLRISFVSPSTAIHKLGSLPLHHPSVQPPLKTEDDDDDSSSEILFFEWDSESVDVRGDALGGFEVDVSGAKIHSVDASIESRAFFDGPIASSRKIDISSTNHLPPWSTGVAFIPPPNLEGQTLTFRIRSIGRLCGSGSWSHPISLEIPRPPPSPIRDLHITDITNDSSVTATVQIQFLPTDDLALVQTRPASSPPSAAITSPYRIEDYSPLAPATLTLHGITGDETGTALVRVRCKGNTGQSPWSNWIPIHPLPIRSNNPSTSSNTRKRKKKPPSSSSSSSSTSTTTKPKPSDISTPPPPPKPIQLIHNDDRIANAKSALRKKKAISTPSSNIPYGTIILIILLLAATFAVIYTAYNILQHPKE